MDTKPTTSLGKRPNTQHTCPYAAKKMRLNLHQTCSSNLEYRDMEYHEKKNLCALIVDLDARGLQHVIDIVAREEPSLLAHQESEWSFDVNVLQTKTLWLIKNFVDNTNLSKIYNPSGDNTSLRDSSETIKKDLKAELQEDIVKQHTELKSETPLIKTDVEHLESGCFGLLSPEYGFSSDLGHPLVTQSCDDDAEMVEGWLKLEDNMVDCANGDENEYDEDFDDALVEDQEDTSELAPMCDSDEPTSLASFVPKKDPTSGKYYITIKVYDLRGGVLKCPECNKKFKDRSNLIKHVRTHTGEKPYVCEECGKSFRHTSTLKDHMNVHKQNNPYTCSFPGCLKQFANKPNLKRHERTHTGEKPFACSVCGQTFSQSSNCKSHEQSHFGQPTRKSRKKKS